jgi:thymidylate synthase (FAD)
MSIEQGLTKREINEGAEKHLGQTYTVLDGLGSVALLNYMGTDHLIAEAARTSYKKGTKKVSNDRGLIRNLIRNDHTSPIEMGELMFGFEMPLYVLAQMSRHRTAKYANENHESGRYSILEYKFFIPAAENVGVQSKKNKQGRGEGVDIQVAEEFRSWLISLGEDTYAKYEYFLNDNGEGQPKDPTRPMIARELARMGLPQNLYTKLIWKCDIHNLLNFLQLRTAPDAQLEIREYADVMVNIVADSFPLCWEAFSDYRLNAIRLSTIDQEIISDIFKKHGIVVTDQEILEALDEKGVKSPDERTGLVKKMSKIVSTKND